jgi:hypothetical protein
MIRNTERFLSSFKTRVRFSRKFSTKNFFFQTKMNNETETKKNDSLFKREFNKSIKLKRNETKLNNHNSRNPVITSSKNYRSFSLSIIQENKYNDKQEEKDFSKSTNFYRNFCLTGKLV